MDGEATVEVDGLCVGYGKRNVLSALSTTLGPGTTAVLGRNGVGKTTFFRALVGLLPIRAGDVVVRGPHGHGDGIRFTPQHCPGSRTLTVEQLVTYLALLDGLRGSRARERVTTALERVGLQDVRDRPSNQLSGGMLKRLSIAQALLLPGEVLILDEPTSGLDPIQREDLLGLIEGLASETLVVFSTHDLDEVVRVASSYVVLAHGGVHREGRVGTSTASDLREIVASTPDPTRLAS